MNEEQDIREYTAEQCSRSRKAYDDSRKYRRKTWTGWLCRFRRMDEYGFVNPAYDRTSMLIGTIVFGVLVTAFIVFMVLAYLESCPPETVF